MTKKRKEWHNYNKKKAYSHLWYKIIIYFPSFGKNLSKFEYHQKNNPDFSGLFFKLFSLELMITFQENLLTKTPIHLI